MTKILVVEDDNDIRTTLEDILLRYGYEVTVAVNGIEGMTAFHAGQPDLVLTDIVMPGKDGIEVIVEMRRARPLIKIIAMSGDRPVGLRDWLETARGLGVSDILGKPFDAATLLERVTRCLALAEPGAQIGGGDDLSDASPLGIAG